ncbi:MAG: ribose-phosphate diphosphokinase [Sulfolobales archaeon]|nr:ribose-phosphate diphosphokinase [Sulfolobales archaeon]MCX8199057.1 ribose-phosphate diphosphokinase [Sulfolobales archaeon]MDW8170036.1 ribose-phosphate diphosphokinase [Desulfurococcaceae archaeon]
MNYELVVLGGSNGEHLAIALSNIGGFELGVVEVKKFPDGETYVRVLTDVTNRRVIYINSLQRNVNDAVFETILTIDALRDLGTKEVIAVIPYMSYARQDARFNSGEAISIHTLAKMFKMVKVDHLITIDMHLHRIHDPSNLFGANFHNITGVRELAKYFKKSHEIENTVIIGPDEEAEQWAKVMAEELGGLEYSVLEKTRLSAERVIVEIRGVNVRGRNVIIVDDIISTGGTIVEAVKALRELGAREIMVGAVHPLLVENAYNRLLRLRLRDLVGTNTILSPISIVDVTPAIHNALTAIIKH